MSAADGVSAAEAIYGAADRLRALCNAGLRYAEDPYQAERYEQILKLSAELTALVDARPLAEIRRRFFEEMRYLTPFAVVDTAVFDGAGRVLLIKRADNGRWAAPSLLHVVRRQTYRRRADCHQRDAGRRLVCAG